MAVARAIIAPATLADLDAVRDLFRAYAASLPIDLEYQNFRAELEHLPGAYAQPGGTLLLARIAHNPAGCVALRRLELSIGEMKRLYVRPEYRGMGLGPALVEGAIAAARGLGYEEMYLDTLPSMSSAQRLYIRRGFREIAPYGGPAAPGTRYLALRLDPLAREQP